MLKSNGLHRPKIRLKKFGFSLKTVPANIAQKLPPQVPSQTIFHHDFQLLAQTAHVRSHSRKRVHTRLSEKDGTQRLTRRSRGLPFLDTAGLCVTSEISLITAFVTIDSTVLLYTYISQFSVAPHYQQQLYLRPSLVVFFNFSHKRSTFAFTPESGYTLAFQRKIAHKGTHAETGVFWMGVVSLPSDRFARIGNLAWPGGRTANFAAFGSWPGVLPKNAESLRNSDALMRVAVPRRRGPAGLRGLFSFLTKLRLVRPIPETSFSSPDAPACAVPAQAAFPLALSRLGAVQGFSVLSFCLTPFLDFEDKKGR